MQTYNCKAYQVVKLMQMLIFMLCANLKPRGWWSPLQFTQPVSFLNLLTVEWQLWYILKNICWLQNNIFFPPIIPTFSTLSRHQSQVGFGRDFIPAAFNRHLTNTFLWDSNEHVSWGRRFFFSHPKSITCERWKKCVNVEVHLKELILFNRF